MVKKTIISLFLLALLVSFVSAVDTEIKIKTLADHKVSIFIYPDSSAASVNSFHAIADEKGEALFIHSSNDPKIDVLVKITKEGEKVFLERFEGYQAGKPISIRVDYDEVSGDYTPQAAVPVVETANKTIEPANAVTAETQPSNQLTGEVVAVNATESSSKAFYFVVVIGILAAIVVVLLVIKRFMPFSQFGSTFKIKSSSSPAYTSSSSYNSGEERRIKEIERKISDAQKELNMVRGQEKIKAAEKRLEQDRRELEKLKFGIMGDSGMQRRTSTTFQRVDQMRDIPIRRDNPAPQTQRDTTTEIKKDDIQQQQDSKKDETFDLS